MNPHLAEELTHILREEGSMPRRLSPTELKVLALELAAAMPPVQREETSSGICPMIGQMRALLESALDDLNSLDSQSSEQDRRHVYNRATWLIDAGITITNRMGVEAGVW